jgi:hypothetical protein
LGPVFRDITDRAGLRTLITSGGTKKDYVVQVNGSGVCWFDYDHDGFVDLYLVNGSTLAQLQGKEPRTAHNRLFRNNGDGTFTDVTAKASVAGTQWGFGCVAADYDNDGNTDLLVTQFGPNLLYHNNGDGTFIDRAAKAGMAGGEIWHAGAAFGDYDNDGFLDLYISGYIDFDRQHPELKTCEYRGVNVHACGPLGYRGAPDFLYHNNGDGTFTDVTAKAGVVDKGLFFGFTVIFDDLNGDGLADIFVANDSNANYFYRNKGDGTFEESAVTSGVAFNADGKEMSGMGVAVGDYDGDGRPDVFVTTFSNDNDVLYHNDGHGFFSDVSFPAGVGEPTVPFLAWATFFFDYDNDGHKDLFVANGHVYPEVEGKIGETYRQPLQLFRNSSDAKFQDASQQAGLHAIPRHSARGGAYADFDNDGDLDVLISNIDDVPQLLENDGSNRSDWLELKLQGTKSNRDAIGARVRVTAGDLVQYDHVRAGGSFLSSNDLRLHFGLGDRKRVDEVRIEWPSGKTERLEKIETNQILNVVEGSGITGTARPARRASPRK